jgi:hypothetical protein
MPTPCKLGLSYAKARQFQQLIDEDGHPPEHVMNTPWTATRP